MACGDVLSLEDLQTAKKHQIFEAEVITGKAGGVAGGVDIDYATNQVTGQTQKTMPAVLRDAGFDQASFTFATGGTLAVNDRDKAVFDPVSKAWYTWVGALPKVVPAGANPVGDSDWRPWTDPTLRAQVFVSTKAQLLSNIADDIPANITSALDGASFDAAESALLLSKLYLVTSTSPVVLYVSSVSVSTGDICKVGDNGNITLSGSSPVETTLTSVDSVSGAAGNFSVTYNVASSIGMAVGDVLCVDQVLPARVHYSSAFTGVRKPVLGEMMIGFNFMGSLTVSGTTCTVTGTGCPTYLEPGFLVHIQGQTRTIQTVSASSFTIDAALDFSPTGLQWWWVSRPATGTVAISGTTVTGTSTVFLSQYDPDDIIVVDGRLLRIVSVASDTQMTISHNQTVPAGAGHSVYKAGLLHEGAFEITGISGNQVTVSNKSRLRKPPKNLITAGRVRCVKTILKNTGSGNGFVFSMGSVLQGIKDIAIVSPGAGTGLALNGSGAASGYNQQTGQVQLLGCAAVVGWSKNAFLSAGAVLVATDQFFSGSSSHGIECTDGGDAYLRNARVHGAGGIGMIAAGGYARVSSAAFVGCGLQGVRQDVGSGVYGDTWYAWGNVSHGVMQVNQCGIQFVDSISCCNGSEGFNTQNLGKGRLSRTLFGGNVGFSINSTNSEHEATQVWVSGSGTGRNGVNCSKGRLDLRDSAQTGCGSSGIYAQQTSVVTADNSVQRGNTSSGARADDVNSVILLMSGYHGGNGSSDITEVAGGRVAWNKNPLSTLTIGSTYRESVVIADDAVASVYVGNNTVQFDLISPSSIALQGFVRTRAGSSPGSVLIAGQGIAASVGVLTGVTGVDGGFTVSPASDGYVYLENRTGSAKTIIMAIMGKIS